MEHVSNKSAYLCGVMKTYRQKTRNRGGDGGVGTGGGKDGATNSDSKAGAPEVKGPDEAKIKVRQLEKIFRMFNLGNALIHVDVNSGFFWTFFGKDL